MIEQMGAKRGSDDILKKNRRESIEMYQIQTLATPFGCQSNSAGKTNIFKK